MKWSELVDKSPEQESQDVDYFRCLARGNASWDIISRCASSLSNRSPPSTEYLPNKFVKNLHKCGVATSWMTCDSKIGYAFIIDNENKQVIGLKTEDLRSLASQSGDRDPAALRGKGLCIPLSQIGTPYLVTSSYSDLVQVLMNDAKCKDAVRDDFINDERYPALLAIATTMEENSLRSGCTIRIYDIPSCIQSAASSEYGIVEEKACIQKIEVPAIDVLQVSFVPNAKEYKGVYDPSSPQSSPYFASDIMYVTANGQVVIHPILTESNPSGSPFQVFGPSSVLSQTVRRALFVHPASLAVATYNGSFYVLNMELGKDAQNEKRACVVLEGEDATVLSMKQLSEHDLILSYFVAVDKVTTHIIYNMATEDITNLGEVCYGMAEEQSGEEEDPEWCVDLAGAPAISVASVPHLKSCLVSSSICADLGVIHWDADQELYVPIILDDGVQPVIPLNNYEDVFPHHVCLDFSDTRPVPSRDAASGAPNLPPMPLVYVVTDDSHLFPFWVVYDKQQTGSPFIAEPVRSIQPVEPSREKPQAPAAHPLTVATKPDTIPDEAKSGKAAPLVSTDKLLPVTAGALTQHDAKASINQTVQCALKAALPFDSENEEQSGEDEEEENGEEADEEEIDDEQQESSALSAGNEDTDDSVHGRTSEIFASRPKSGGQSSKSTIVEDSFDFQKPSKKPAFEETSSSQASRLALVEDSSSPAFPTNAPKRLSESKGIDSALPAAKGFTIDSGRPTFSSVKSTLFPTFGDAPSIPQKFPSGPASEARAPNLKRQDVGFENLLEVSQASPQGSSTAFAKSVVDSHHRHASLSTVHPGASSALPPPGGKGLLGTAPTLIDSNKPRLPNAPVSATYLPSAGPRPAAHSAESPILKSPSPLPLDQPAGTSVPPESTKTDKEAVPPKISLPHHEKPRVVEEPISTIAPAVAQGDPKVQIIGILSEISNEITHSRSLARETWVTLGDYSTELMENIEGFNAALQNTYHQSKTQWKEHRLNFEQFCSEVETLVALDRILRTAKQELQDVQSGVLSEISRVRDSLLDSRDAQMLEILNVKHSEIRTALDELGTMLDHERQRLVQLQEERGESARYQQLSNLLEDSMEYQQLYSSISAHGIRIKRIDAMFASISREMIMYERVLSSGVAASPASRVSLSRLSKLALSLKSPMRSLGMTDESRLHSSLKSRSAGVTGGTPLQYVGSSFAVGFGVQASPALLSSTAKFHRSRFESPLAVDTDRGTSDSSISAIADKISALSGFGPVSSSVLKSSSKRDPYSGNAGLSEHSIRALQERARKQDRNHIRISNEYEYLSPAFQRLVPKESKDKVASGGPMIPGGKAGELSKGQPGSQPGERRTLPAAAVPEEITKSIRQLDRDTEKRISERSKPGSAFTPLTDKNLTVKPLDPSQVSLGGGFQRREQGFDLPTFPPQASLHPSKPSLDLNSLKGSAGGGEPLAFPPLSAAQAAGVPSQVKASIPLAGFGSLSTDSFPVSKNASSSTKPTTVTTSTTTPDTAGRPGESKGARPASAALPPDGSENDRPRSKAELSAKAAVKTVVEQRQIAKAATVAALPPDGSENEKPRSQSELMGKAASGAVQPKALSSSISSSQFPLDGPEKQSAKSFGFTLPSTSAGTVNTTPTALIATTTATSKPSEGGSGLTGFGISSLFGDSNPAANSPGNQTTAVKAEASSGIFGKASETQSSGFGSATQAMSSFGQPLTSSTLSSGFAAFGASSPAAGIGSAFGAAKAASSPFGSVAPPAASGSAFGSPSSLGFGTNAAASAFGSASPLGNSSSATTSAFGTAAATTASLGFGALAAKAGASGFGTGTVGFGAPTGGTTGFPATSAAAPGFGTAASGTGFGSAAVPFGSPGTAVVSSSAFGSNSTGFGFSASSSAMTPSAGFGSSMSASTISTSLTSGFGQMAPLGASQNAFGAPSSLGAVAPSAFGSPSQFGTPAAKTGFGSTSSVGFGSGSTTAGFAVSAGGGGGGGGFGALAAQGSGGGGFGAWPTQGPTGGGGFGAASDGNGFRASASGGGGFGSAGTATGFGQFTQSPNPSGFGQPAAQSSPSGFGQFGGNQPMGFGSGAPPSTMTGFGGLAANAGSQTSGFGAVAPSSFTARRM